MTTIPQGLQASHFLPPAVTAPVIKVPKRESVAAMRPAMDLTPGEQKQGVLCLGPKEPKALITNFKHHDISFLQGKEICMNSRHAHMHVLACRPHPLQF